MAEGAVNTWRVGDVRITRIVEIEGIPSPPRFLFSSLTKEEVIAQRWLHPHFATAEGKLRLSIHAFIIEAGGRRIIVDTCIGNDKERRVAVWNRLQGPFLADLAAAGFPAETIDTVLCTHLHVDHVGWNTRWDGARWVPTFPNARYLFGRREWEHWSGERERGSDGDEVPEAHRIYDDSVRPIIDAGLHQLVEMDHRLNEEVALEPTPGHTPGHVSVRISSRGEAAVITGDLMHHPIQCAMPDLCSDFDSDPAMARETRRGFLARYADRPVLVLGTHFATPTAGWIVAEGDSWRLRVTP